MHTCVADEGSFTSFVNIRDIVSAAASLQVAVQYQEGALSSLIQSVCSPPACPLLTPPSNPRADS